MLESLDTSHFAPHTHARMHVESVSSHFFIEQRLNFVSLITPAAKPNIGNQQILLKVQFKLPLPPRQTCPKQKCSFTDTIRLSRYASISTFLNPHHQFLKKSKLVVLSSMLTKQSYGTILNPCCERQI